MKQIITKTLLFITLFFIIGGCFPKKYIYDFDYLGLKHPIDKVQTEFKARQAYISVKITNNTVSPIKVLWEESSFVVDGRAMRPVYGNTTLYRMSYPQLITVIPENSYIENAVVPWDNLYYVSGSKNNNSYWEVYSFFPSKHPLTKRDTPPQSYIGKSLRFDLCVEIGGLKKYVETEYTVKAVRLKRIDGLTSTDN